MMSHLSTFAAVERLAPDHTAKRTIRDGTDITAMNTEAVESSFHRHFPWPRSIVGAQRDSQSEAVLYGESVGHYEGDTLVVDTIGKNDNPRHVGKQPPSADHGPFQAWQWTVTTREMTAVAVIGDN